jgi:hypothetical protein
MALTAEEIKRLVRSTAVVIVSLVALACLLVMVDRIKPRHDPDTEITSEIRVMPSKEFLLVRKTVFEFGTMYMVEDMIDSKMYIVVSNGGSLTIIPRTNTEKETK